MLVFNIIPTVTGLNGFKNFFFGGGSRDFQIALFLLFFTSG